MRSQYYLCQGRFARLGYTADLSASRFKFGVAVVTRGPLETEMHRYKTLVTDYEGMQEALDSSAEAGWNLVSVTPDHWRKVTGRLGERNPMVSMDEGVAPSSEEYSATYYLLVFVRQDGPSHQRMELSEASEIPFEGL